MNLDRIKAPALAATAVLLISGAASAFAAGPAPTVPAAPTPIVQTEPAGADADTLQVGDQTTPDVAGAAEAAAPETAGAAEADGPGGHADAADQNVDHQFDGQE
jgi:hypothetical protein